MKPEEIKKIVCNIVRFKRENQPWDIETMVICIGLIPNYKTEATAILDSLGQHRQAIPKMISRGIEIPTITTQIAKEGRQIREDMEDLVREFLEKECQGD